MTDCVVTTDRSLPSCEAVTKPACLTNNLSGLRNETKARLQNLTNRLAPVLNSSCSSNLTRLACILQIGPCVTNKGQTLDTCQSLRKEVRESCKDELQRHNISLPLYVPNYPEVSAGDGLCYLSRWPVPLPKPGLFYSLTSNFSRPKIEELSLILRSGATEGVKRFSYRISNHTSKQVMKPKTQNSEVKASLFKGQHSNSSYVLQAFLGNYRVGGARGSLIPNIFSEKIKTSLAYFLQVISQPSQRLLKKSVRRP